MILKLKDGTEINLTTAEAKAIQDNLDNSDIRYIHVGDQSFDKGMIRAILRGGQTEADWLGEAVEATKRIEAKDRCRGQYSIHWQIAMIAHDVSGEKSDANPEGKKWPELVNDKAWKEMTRQRLRAMQPEGWCDYEAGECACDSGYMSDQPRHKPDWVSHSKGVQ